jgi:integration host factor subunit alpha
MTLTKKNLAESIQDELEVTGARSTEILETLLEVLKRTLESGDEVLIRGFGKFYVNEKKARRGRNPATGEDLVLPARRVVRFKCSDKLRRRINDNE